MLLSLKVWESLEMICIQAMLHASYTVITNMEKDLRNLLATASNSTVRNSRVSERPKGAEKKFLSLS
jgi:hypothetical protein